jgi:hypothetical protein
MVEVTNPFPIEKVERKGTGYNQLERLDITNDDLFSFEQAHKKYKLVVQEVIEGWPPASNSDLFLYLEVLRALDLCQATSGKDNYCFKIKRENIKFLPCPESIRRSRQSLNAKGLCLATDPRVLELRKRKEVIVRNYFAKEKADAKSRQREYSSPVSPNKEKLK